MNWFGRKSAGRDASRPVLSRGFSTWAGANTLGEWPRAYEPQVRDGYRRGAGGCQTYGAGGAAPRML